jgi:hypothetical protein
LGSVLACTTQPPTLLTKEAAEGERCAFFWVLLLRLVTTGIKHRKRSLAWPAFFCLTVTKRKKKKAAFGLYILTALWVDGWMFIQKKSDLSAKAHCELGMDGWMGGCTD